jgi:hypothetical protein
MEIIQGNQRIIFKSAAGGYVSHGPDKWWLAVVISISLASK